MAAIVQHTEMFSAWKMEETHAHNITSNIWFDYMFWVKLFWLGYTVVKICMTTELVDSGFYATVRGFNHTSDIPSYPLHRIWLNNVNG